MTLSTGWEDGEALTPEQRQGLVDAAVAERAAILAGEAHLTATPTRSDQTTGGDVMSEWDASAALITIMGKVGRHATVNIESGNQVVVTRDIDGEVMCVPLRPDALPDKLWDELRAWATTHENNKEEK